jgi:hypothetical protein
MINATAKTTAAAFRKELAATFPGIKFSVRMSMSGWLTVMNIEWTDGPTSNELKAIAKKLEECEFDRHNDDVWDKIKGVETGISIVSTSRHISKDLKAEVAQFLSRTFDGWRFSHKSEFVEAVDHLQCSPKTWTELEANEDALAGIVRWVAEGSPMVSGLAQMWADCADF